MIWILVLIDDTNSSKTFMSFYKIKIHMNFTGSKEAMGPTSQRSNKLQTNEFPHMSVPGDGISLPLGLPFPVTKTMGQELPNKFIKF